MNFRLLTAKEYPRWYHDQLSEAFVPQERKPLPDILRLLEEGRYEVWGLFDEDELLSYAALWKMRQYHWYCWTIWEPHTLVVMKGWAVIYFRGWSSRDVLW